MRLPIFSFSRFNARLALLCQRQELNLQYRPRVNGWVVSPVNSTLAYAGGGYHKRRLSALFCPTCNGSFGLNPSGFHGYSSVDLRAFSHHICVRLSDEASPSIRSQQDLNLHSVLQASSAI